MKYFYYPETHKRYAAALAKWFTDIYVRKLDKDMSILEEIKVPLLIGPINKAYSDTVENHTYDGTSSDGTAGDNLKKYYQSTPRLALLCNDLSYDSVRSRSVNSERNLYTPDGEITEDITPVPYNYTFHLYIKSHSIDFFYQIIENILPYFNPSKKLRVKEFPFINIERDLNVTLSGGVNPEFKIPKDNNARGSQEIETSIGFTVEGYMYRPLTTASVIEMIKIHTGILHDNQSIQNFLLSTITAEGITNEAEYENLINVYGV